MIIHTVLLMLSILSLWFETYVCPGWLAAKRSDDPSPRAGVGLHYVQPPATHSNCLVFTQSLIC